MLPLVIELAFAVAQLANKYGYPFLSTTGNAKKLLDMKMAYFFGTSWTRRAVDACAGRRRWPPQKVKTAAIGYMDDLFGLERYRHHG